MNLTFHWPDYRKVSFALPGFILLSALLHGVSFMLFQAYYPPSVMLRPPPAGVMLLTPSSPENRVLLSWIEAGDPAAAAKPHEVVPPGLLDLPYRPSYAELYTEPNPASPSYTAAGKVAEYPSIIDSQALIAGLAREKPAASTPAVTPQMTQVRISEGLASRAPKMSWQAANPTLISTPGRILEPAQFLIGVSASGEVAYQFLQHSSGEPKIDTEAESLIAASIFKPSPTMSWGMISFYWGSDVYHPTDSPSRAATAAHAGSQTLGMQ